VVDSQFKPTGAVIIAYEEELPGAVYIGLTRYRVSVYVPTPTRCDKCQRFGHRADQCKSAELRCSRCGKNHEFKDCTVEKERAKCANCGENHSSAYRGCKKYREVKETLKVAATEKLSEADALKQKRATKRVEKPATVENPPVVEAVVTNERKSVETQSGTEQAVKTDKPCENCGKVAFDRYEQIIRSQRKTVKALLFLLTQVQTSEQSSQVRSTLVSLLKKQNMFTSGNSEQSDTDVSFTDSSDECESPSASPARTESN